MRAKHVLALSIAVFLSACDTGVDLGDQTSSQTLANTAASDSSGSLASDSLSFDDIEARAFFPVTFIPQMVIAHVDCVSDSNTITVDQMSYTNGFVREPFSEFSDIDTLRATESVEQAGSQYIEVCVHTEIDRDYYIETRVFAPSIKEDSFFFTVGDSDPVIYDVSRSSTFDLVRSRNTDPLRVSLSAGQNILRFHYRERNTELFQINLIRLPNDDTGIDITDGNFNTDILLCASRTGQEPALIETLIAQHMPNDQFKFGRLVNTSDANNTTYSEIDGDFDTPTVYCLSDMGPFNTGSGVLPARNRVLATLAPTLILGSSTNDTLASPLGDNVVFYGFGGDDTVQWQVGGQFYGGTDQDQVIGMTSGLFDGEGGNNRVRLTTTESLVSNAVIDNIGLSPDPLTQLELTGFEDVNANVTWPDDTDAFFTIEGSESFPFLDRNPGAGVRSLSVRINRPGETFTVTGRSLVEFTIPANSDNALTQIRFSTVSLLSSQTVDLSFTAP